MGEYYLQLGSREGPKLIVPAGRVLRAVSKKHGGGQEIEKQSPQLYRPHLCTATSMVLLVVGIAA